jgi:Trk-type K+ transport system membrane component
MKLLFRMLIPTDIFQFMLLFFIDSLVSIQLGLILLKRFNSHFAPIIKVLFSTVSGNPFSSFFQIL